jgi:cytochrome oxidase assembly protein ShyY1
VVRFRNAHLTYALTWFALAAGLAVLALRAVRR